MLTNFERPRSCATCALSLVPTETTETCPRCHYRRDALSRRHSFDLTPNEHGVVVGETGITVRELGRELAAAAMPRRGEP